MHKVTIKKVKIVDEKNYIYYYTFESVDLSKIKKQLIRDSFGNKAWVQKLTITDGMVNNQRGKIWIYPNKPNIYITEDGFYVDILTPDAEMAAFRCASILARCGVVKGWRIDDN